MKKLQKMAYVSSTTTTKMQEVPSKGPHHVYAIGLRQARKCIHIEFFLDFLRELESMDSPCACQCTPPHSKEETWPPLPMPPPPPLDMARAIDTWGGGGCYEGNNIVGLDRLYIHRCL